MPQSTFKSPAAAGSADVVKQLKDAGATVAGVKWVNVNAEGLIVVTHDDAFDKNAFLSAVQTVDGGVNE